MAPETVTAKADLDRVLQALRFAATHHVEGDAVHVRKGTSIPCLSHLMIVAGYVWESGGDTNQAIAAVLHDTQVSREQLHSEFGEDVADLVVACSDGLDGGRRDESTWRERKQHYVEALPGKNSRALLVTAADKAHNGSAIVVDIETHGEGVRKRFNTPSPGDVSWHYEGVVAVVEDRLAGLPIVARLRATVLRLSELAKKASH